MHDYLAAVTPDLAERLAKVNAAGVAALRAYLASGEAVAFLGAGASMPLYPLWAAVISDLIDAAADRGLDSDKATTCRTLASEQPDAVVELLRRHLGAPQYQSALRQVFRVRRDPDSGRTWTPTQELVCRCAFKAVVTTNYDPGIVDARMRVRPLASGTGFTSWTDELALDRWRTGEVFGDAELPVLFAHGHHNQPDAMVLATTEYRRAYAGKLSRVLATMIDGWHLVWIGFSFTDQRINGVLREIAEHSGTRIDPGRAARHVAIMGWDPDGGRDPETLRTLAELQYGAELILYPASSGDHSALQPLLAEFTAADHPPVAPTASVAPPGGDAAQSAESTAPSAGDAESPGGSYAADGGAAQPEDAGPTSSPRPALPVHWSPPAEPVEHFTGRVDELARLHRWAADPTVRLIGVTAWGGAGKTALVTQWTERAGGPNSRPDIRGVFGWSFYADSSAEHWAESLLDWAGKEFGARVVGRGRLGTAVLALLEHVPLVLVLDGLEVVQEGPNSGQFGRLLDGTLREVLTGACHLDHAGLVLLTSRFVFADLEAFDGGAARMLDVPPFTPVEGSALLASAGGGWLPERERQDLVAGVDGHALAVAALGGILADRPPTADLKGLRDELAAATTTNARVARVLRFYADRLSEADRYLVAAVALFSRPVTPEAVLSVASDPTFGDRLSEWAVHHIQTAARDRLAGLLSWHPDGSLSAHPLVRETFRPLALGAAEVAAEATLTGVPAGKITNREDGLRAVEAIELLIDADQWQAADDVYRNRTDGGRAWKHLPAARLGQRAASAFVATAARRQLCPDRLSPRHLGFYLNEVGLSALNGGDLATARQYLNDGIAHDQDLTDARSEAVGWQNLAECLDWLGEIDLALQATARAGARAKDADDREGIADAAALDGLLLSTRGDTEAAEERFIAADQDEHTNDADGDHLYSLRGVWWGEFLARTDRADRARQLIDRNRAISAEQGWNENLARCDRLLGHIDLMAGNTTDAAPRLAAAVITFRDGDFLTELVATLTVLAECARADGDLDAAERHTTEAITIAAPRQLRLIHAGALTVRAHIYADRAAAGSTAHLEQGRDAAESAHRIATRHRLAWHELDALEVHAHLDRVAGVDNGWASRATDLRKRLIPPGLDPDPLATVERLVAEKKARGNPTDTS